MEKIRNRCLVSFAVLFITALTVNFLSYDTFHKANASIRAIEKIPLRLGRWYGVDVTLEERIYEILETKSIINRIYSLNGNSVFLSILYYPETKFVFLAPESCLGCHGGQQMPHGVFIRPHVPVHTLEDTA